MLNPLQICTQIVFFFFIIYSVHYVWVYILNYVAPKKTIHLVDNQIEKYKQIMEEMQKQKSVEKLTESGENLTDLTESEIIKDDLNQFIKTYL